MLMWALLRKHVSLLAAAAAVLALLLWRVLWPLLLPADVRPTLLLPRPRRVLRPHAPARPGAARIPRRGTTGEHHAPRPGRRAGFLRRRHDPANGDRPPVRLAPAAAGARLPLRGA